MVVVVVEFEVRILVARTLVGGDGVGSMGHEVVVELRMMASDIEANIAPHMACGSFLSRFKEAYLKAP